MNTIIKLLVNAAAVMATAYLLPGVGVDSFWSAIAVAAVLAILNIFVKPLLVLFTLPATILTLGLFLTVINAVIVLLADWVLDGFNVNNFWWALLFSIIMSLIASLLEKLVLNDKKEKKQAKATIHIDRS